MTYAEKLKDPRWQKKRLEIFERDNWQCVICKNDSNTLHVHHISYEYGVEPWDYENINFKTLCDKCHKDEEFCKPYVKAGPRLLQECGYSNSDLLMIFTDLMLKKRKEVNNG